LHDAQLAKKAALQSSNVGKNLLAREVRQLYGMLQNAKQDNEEKEELITELREQVHVIRAETDEILHKCDMDRDVFARMIKVCGIKGYFC
jgi:hypothetical protein